MGTVIAKHVLGGIGRDLTCPSNYLYYPRDVFKDRMYGLVLQGFADLELVDDATERSMLHIVMAHVDDAPAPHYNGNMHIDSSRSNRGIRSQLNRVHIVLTQKYAFSY